MVDHLWKIEAIDSQGFSLGVADVVTFTNADQAGVISFKAIWPVLKGVNLRTFDKVVIEGKPIQLQKPVTIGQGDVLRVSGLANARWATRGGQLDG